MTHSLKDITQLLGIKYSGGDHQITGIHDLSHASSSQISFINEDKYILELSNTKAIAVLMSHKYLEYLPKDTIALLTDNSYLDMAKASKLFSFVPSIKGSEPVTGERCQISPSASFGEDVAIGDDVTIMAGCYIGDGTRIASGSILYPNTTLYHHCQIGKRCIIHSGVVIGADGYGFTHQSDGTHIKIYQNGNVVIGDDVEIGANSTIDRAVFGSTAIGSGTKIDNLVQIAHNCHVGKNCLLVCQTALAGSTILGDNVVMGGQSGSTGHLSIGDGAMIASRAGVTKTIEGGKVYGGFPVMEHKLWLKIQAKMSALAKRKTNQK